MITVTIMKKENVQKHGWEYSGWEFSGANSIGRNLIGGNLWDGVFKGEIFLIPTVKCVEIFRRKTLLSMRNISVSRLCFFILRDKKYMS